jgi:tetratricopeptide (TPR) repeat protein
MDLRVLVAGTFILCCVGCASPVADTRPTPGDQLPMYGGMDRQAVPLLRKADNQLVEDSVKEFGSRENASASLVNTGYKYYYRDEFDKAMRIFNQAWLLNPNNPQVYWGFGSVLHDKKKYCEAKVMLEKALALNPPDNRGFYPDAGRIYTLCAVNDPALSAEDKANLIDQSEMLYRKGEKTEPGKAYLYSSWATAYYWRGQYEDAWKMIEKQRVAGGAEPSEPFISMLRAKMPEPPRTR